MNTSTKKTLLLAAMAITISTIGGPELWHPVLAEADPAETAKTMSPADFVQQRSALLERLLVAKRFGIERQDFEKALKKIDTQYTKSNDLAEASKNLKSLADSLELQLKMKIDSEHAVQASAADAPPLDWQSYARQLSRRIPRSWYPPKCCPQKPPSVSFELHPDGTVSNIKLLSPTSNKEMDLSVERAVKNASPFAKFSSEKPFEKVIFHFDIGRPNKAELVR